MTSDEVDKLEGRDLDRAVGWHVMGWRVNPPKFPGWGATCPAGRWYKEDGSFIQQSEWQPHKEIAAAWEVVEKMHPLMFKLQNVGDLFDAYFFDAHFYEGDVELKGGVLLPTLHKSAPTAISRAALKAVLAK